MRGEKHNGIEEDLPYGFPEKLTSSMVWDANDISISSEGVGNEKPYLLVLTDDQIAEIDSALRRFQG
jgi:hypothetical protein